MVRLLIFLGLFLQSLRLTSALLFFFLTGPYNNIQNWDYVKVSAFPGNSLAS